MAPGYRHDDARANGGTSGPPRGADPEATPYRRTRLPEGNGPRDRGPRPYPEPTAAPTATYDDARYDRGRQDRSPYDSGRGDGGYREHRDSRRESDYYKDDDYRGSRYDEREDQYRYRGREEAGYRDGGRGEYSGRDGYRKSMDDRNAESFDDGPGSGEETRRVTPEELGLPDLKRRGRQGQPGRGSDGFDDRTTVDVPKQRREPRPSNPDSESTMILPKQGGSDERTERFTPRAGAAGLAGAAGAGATRAMGGRADDASTQIIRNPEDLPRIDIPGGGDDQATQLFSRPDDLGRPVFVDEGGKRGKRMKILVRVIGVICLLFLAGMVFALTGGGNGVSKLGTGEQKSETPAPAKTSAKATPKASATARVGVQPSTTRRSENATKTTTPAPRRATSPTPKQSDDNGNGNGNGGLPTVLPTTLFPTTPSAAADPPTSAPADGNANGRGNGRGTGN